jgi:polyisoprenoid-binding protein YceI
MMRLFAMTVLCLVAAALPARAGEDVYDIAKPHTQILFSVDHMGFSRSYGKFLGYDGHFKLDDDHPEKPSVEAVIHTDSIDMGDRAWDKAVKGIFKTDKFPDMIFKSTAVRRLSKKTADVIGNLTLLGVTRPVTLHVTFNKEGRNPFGKYICGFSAYADIKRSDFGMKDYLPVVGDDVHIIIETEGNRHDKPGQEQYNQ